MADVKYLDSQSLEGICIYFGENKKDINRTKQSLALVLNKESTKKIKKIISDISNKKIDFDSSQLKILKQYELKCALSQDNIEEYNAPDGFDSTFWLSGRKDKIRYVGELFHKELNWDEIKRGDLLLINSVPTIHFGKMGGKNYLTFYIDKVYRLQQKFAQISGPSGTIDAEGLSERLEELRKQAKEVVIDGNEEIPDFE